ncbi:hypothetical protein MXB_5469, partial [Myxobolus squamalis]
LGVEIRRYSFVGLEIQSFKNFYKKILVIHRLNHELDPLEMSNSNLFLKTHELWYKDPNSKEFFPINNDNNYARALSVSKICTQVFILEEGSNPNVKGNKKTKMSAKKLVIGPPTNFRPVSCMLDNDYLPDSFIRVRMCKHDTEKRLVGIYISGDVVSNDEEFFYDSCQEINALRIFISRIEPGSIAESTGVISVGDEIVEVNGIIVDGKDIDQVVEMMIVNSNNLTLTLRSAKVSKILSAFNRQSTIRISKNGKQNFCMEMNCEPIVFNV